MGVGDDTNVDITVRWGEAGGDVPGRVANRLRDLHRGFEPFPNTLRDLHQKFAQTAAEGDRLGNAFARVEAREPSQALRRTKLMIEEMALEAAGAQGPVARLGASLALLAPGVLGLTAAGTVAAVGIEIKTLLGTTKELEDALGKVNLEFAQMAGGGAAARARITQIDERITETRAMSPSFKDRLRMAAGMIGSLGTSDAETQSFIQRQQGTEATLENERERALEQMHEEHQRRLEQQQQKEREFQRTLYTSEAAVNKLQLGLHPTNVQLAALESQSRLVAIATSNLTEEQKTRLQLLEEERAVLEHVNAATKDRQDADDRRRHDEMAFPTVPTAGDIYNRARLGQGGNVSPTTDPQGAGTTPFENTIRGASAAAAGTYNPGPPPVKGQREERDWERMGGAIMRGLTMITSARGGNEGAAALGALGETASAAAGLKTFSKIAPTLGPVGFGLSAASTLLSLGHGPKPQVVIASYEAQALAQMKELRGEPLTTQVIVVGAVDMRQVQQQLARLNRLGVLTRLPR